MKACNMQHRIENLCYQLVQGEVCLEPLRILARREVTWNGWKVAFHVLGASHAITLERDDICITELFTCAPVKTEASVLAQSEGQLPMQLCPDVPGFYCRVKLERFALVVGNALRHDAPQTNTLVVEFPHASGDIAPITRLNWKTTGNILRIQTIHTYPEEHCGVHSETILQAVETEQRSRLDAIQTF